MKYDKNIEPQFDHRKENYKSTTELIKNKKVNLEKEEFSSKNLWNHII